MLFAAARVDPAHLPPTYEDRLATTREIVRSTKVQIATSAILLIDVEHSLRTTCDVIRRTRLAIYASDRVIARSQNLDDPAAPPTHSTHLTT
jgi:hypothetical protein